MRKSEARHTRESLARLPQLGPRHLLPSSQHLFANPSVQQSPHPGLCRSQHERIFSNAAWGNGVSHPTTLLTHLISLQLLASSALPRTSKLLASSPWPSRCSPGQAWIWSMVTALLHFHSTAFLFSSVLPLTLPVNISSPSLRPAHGSSAVMAAETTAGSGTQDVEAVHSRRVDSSVSLCFSLCPSPSTTCLCS